MQHVKLANDIGQQYSAIACACVCVYHICTRIKFMDGRTDGWMDGWMDRRMDGWTDGWTDGWMGRYVGT